jgi:hypothetical protein
MTSRTGWVLPASGQPWNRTRPLTAYQTVPVNQLGRCPRSGRRRRRAPRPSDRHKLSKPVAAPAAHLPPSLPRLEYEHMEPPPGADPGRPLYESGAAAVRGGVAASRGFEPRFPEPESGVLPVGRKGTGCGRRDSNAQTARSELARSPNCRHFRVRRPGIEPGFPRLRVECFTDIARGACHAVGVSHGRSRPHHLPGSPTIWLHGPAHCEKTPWPGP